MSITRDTMYILSSLVVSFIFFYNENSNRFFSLINYYKSITIYGYHFQPISYVISFFLLIVDQPIFPLEPVYIHSLFWIVIGIVLGLIKHEHVVEGIRIAALVPFSAYFILNVILWLSQTMTTYYEINNFWPRLLALMFFTGIGGAIGSAIYPKKQKMISKQQREDYKPTLPIECPKCKSKIYSNAAICPYCGYIIRPEILKEIEQVPLEHQIIK